MKIAVIPARGGSKRIPRKNIRNFAGQPMLAYPIKAALTSGIFDRIVVSTDDEEIAKIAIEYGALVPFLRQPHLADDFTGTGDVIRDAIMQLLTLGWKIDYCACIYATTPLLSPETICETFKLMQNEDADYAFTAAQFSFPIQRALVKTATGGIEPFDSKMINQRSQDLVDTFHDAGQLYWASAKTWLDTKKTVFSESSRMFVLPDHLVKDIDTLKDWHHAELLFNVLQRQNF